jgi:hypothetical protein
MVFMTFSKSVVDFCFGTLLISGIGTTLYATGYENPLRGDLGVHDPVMTDRYYG